MPTLEPQPVRWTVPAYDRLTRLGAFDHQRVELLQGRIVRMPPQMEPHVAGVHRAAKAAMRVFGGGCYIRIQSPLKLGTRSKPEPDVAVVPGCEEDYVQRGAPTSALLVIEVSDTTLKYDRTRKASAYARFGIMEFWILNVVDGQLEVHRRPVADAAHPGRFRYGDIQILKRGDTVSPLGKPDVIVAVSELL